MRLDLGLIYIKDIFFGPKTSIAADILSIDRRELISLLEQEPLFERVEIELARPGDSCRIIRVLDVVEPRYRLDGPNFPGALEPNGLVGSGQTRALKNVAVIETDQLATRSRNIIDMCGPATDYSPIGDTHNVVLLPYPKTAADKDDYRLAVKKAGLKT
ncbi:MAG TPA: glycine/sarcosine/betaine reductase component B subunit, partial [Candidatus Binatia bacterium]